MSSAPRLAPHTSSTSALSRALHPVDQGPQRLAGQSAYMGWQPLGRNGVASQLLDSDAIILDTETTGLLEKSDVTRGHQHEGQAGLSRLV